jgi:excinuclease UvrABC nuclease subunit
MKYYNLNDKLKQKQFLEDNREKAGIYRLINLKNTKAYIGSSINLSSRLLKYFNINKKDKRLINLAILKYGLDNFSLDILEYCSSKNVIEREQYYMDLYKPKYNVLKKAGSSIGYIHSEQSLAKMRSRVVSEDTLNKMRNRRQSELTKAKISKANGISVKIIDINSEEIRIFNSKEKAGKYLKISGASISRYIKSGKL